MAHALPNRVSLEPKLLGFYGLTSNYEYEEKGSFGLRCFRYPTEPYEHNLSAGFGDTVSSYDASNDHRDKLKNIVNWMENHKSDITNGRNKPTIDIVCEPGLFKTMLNAQFEDPKEPVSFAASKYKGIIFIKRIDLKKSSREDSLNSYVGMKFTEIFTEKVDPNDYCKEAFSVFKINIDRTNILYSCTVDCIKRRTNKPRKWDLVELVTAPRIRTDNQRFLFGSVFSRLWWSKCIMAGASEIYVGIKDEEWNGNRRIVNCRDIEIVDTSDLPFDAINWNTESAPNALLNLLNRIRNEVVEDNPNIVHIYKVMNRDNISLEKKRICSDNGDFPVITEQMIQKLDQLFD